MIKKLRRRYLITNMALLSGTLLICLAALFGFLYHTEITSSYTIMQEMIQDTQLPERPTADIPSEPTVFYGDSAAVPLMYNAPDCDNDDWNDDQDCGEWNDDDNQYWRGYKNGNSYWQPPEENHDQQDPNGQQNPNGQYWDPSWQPWDPWNPWNPWNPWSPWNPWTHPGVYPPYDPNWQWPQDQQPEQPDGSSQDQNEQVIPDNTQPYIQEQTEDPVPEEQPQEEIQQQPEEQYTEETVPLMTKPPEEAEISVETNAPRARRSDTKPAKHEAPASTETTTVPAAAAAPVTSDLPLATAPIVPVQEGQYVPDALIAQLDSDGNITSYTGNDESYTEDEHFRILHNAVNEVKRRGKQSGVMEIGETSYRFRYAPDKEGHLRLVLLDRTLELSTLHRLLFIFIMITILGLLLMFAVSMKLANWTVTPIAVAWEKQKQFVADASHELKTPLAVISANTEVILANPQESVSGQNKWLSYIQSETMRMSKLITNLLSVARMDNGKQKKESLKPIALSEAVSNVCLVFEPIIYENGKTLNTVIQRNVTLRTEEDNVKQLLSILLDNAVLHSVPQAQITVALSKDVQGKIRLSVSNTAKDIPKEQLAHLFDRFYRLDTEGSPNGSGLGLSIAKSIVRQMGGTLTVTSENQLVTFVAVFS